MITTLLTYLTAAFAITVITVTFFALVLTIVACLRYRK